MPSACACSISCLFACILSMSNTEVSVTSAPCLAETVGHVVRQVAGDRALGEVGRLGVLDVAEAARDGGDVDRGVAAADHHHALADVAQAAVVEGLQERGGGHHVGRVAAGHRQRAAGLRAHAEEHRVELASRICSSVMSVPTRRLQARP